MKPRVFKLYGAWRVECCNGQVRWKFKRSVPWPRALARALEHYHGAHQDGDRP